MYLQIALAVVPHMKQRLNSSSDMQGERGKTLILSAVEISCLHSSSGLYPGSGQGYLSKRRAQLEGSSTSLQKHGLPCAGDQACWRA